MKNYIVLGTALFAVLALGSCKSKETAYKKAYERSQQQQQAATDYAPTQQNVPVEVTPVTPVQQPTQPVDVSNVPVRTENVTVVSGAGLQAFSVVCGSFGVKANAEGLQAVLAQKGYAAQIAINPTNNMYRVIASTHADKASAVTSRDVLRATYPDAWLLYKK